MRLLILAGGFGSRIRTAVADVPKALAPVGEVPFLHLQLAHWLAQGLHEFTFLLYHQADQIIAFLQEQAPGLLKDCQIDWLIEPKPLDTGGAVAHAVSKLHLNGSILVTNADTWVGGGVQQMVQATSPAMVVAKLADPSRYGQVHFDDDAIVTAFAEKCPRSKSGWINAGLYHLDAGLFNDWNGQPFSLERNLFSALVQSRSLMAIPLQTDFIDIGVPDDYYRFCRWIEADRKGTLWS